MNKYIALVLIMLCFACQASVQTTPATGSSGCASIEDATERAACFEKEVRRYKGSNEALAAALVRKQGREQAAVAQPPPPPVSPLAAGPSVPMAPAFGQTTTVLVPEQGTCRFGYTMVVQNDSQKFVEIAGDNVVLCGGSGVVQMLVKTRDGSRRIGYLVPPGATSRYTYLDSGPWDIEAVGYDAPWPDKSGQVVATQVGSSHKVSFRHPSDGSRGVWNVPITNGMIR